LKCNHGDIVPRPIANLTEDSTATASGARPFLENAEDGVVVAGTTRSEAVVVLGAKNCVGWGAAVVVGRIPE
jgi:hypothetical protein